MSRTRIIDDDMGGLLAVALLASIRGGRDTQRTTPAKPPAPEFNPERQPDESRQAHRARLRAHAKGR